MISVAFVFISGLAIAQNAVGTSLFKRQEEALENRLTNIADLAGKIGEGNSEITQSGTQLAIEEAETHETTLVHIPHIDFNSPGGPCHKVRPTCQEFEVAGIYCPVCDIGGNYVALQKFGQYGVA